MWEELERGVRGGEVQKDNTFIARCGVVGITYFSSKLWHLNWLWISRTWFFVAANSYAVLLCWVCRKFFDLPNNGIVF